MNDVLKQSIIDLLVEAKAHIEAGETAAAVEKIDAAISEVENEGVEPTAGDEGNTNPDPENPPLPGQGNNGHI